MPLPMKRIALAAVAALAACALASGCSAQQAHSAGTLKVGVLTDIAGMSEYDEANDRYYGMEVDLAEGMAARMGYSGVEFVGVSSDDRAKVLADGTADAVAACVSVTDQRRQTMDFSDAYYTDRMVVMVENSSLITSFDGLKGGTIGTLKGSSNAKELRQKLKEEGLSSGKVKSFNKKKGKVRYDTWSLREFDTLNELSDALEAGTVDAFAMDGSIARNYLDSGRRLIEGFSGEEQSYAVATAKGSELSSKVSEAVKSMIDDGTVEGLKEKWS